MTQLFGESGYRSLVGAVCLGLFVLCSNCAWSNELCPRELDTQQTASAVPPGYEVAEDTFGRHQLTYVEVFDGPVEEMASLVPDEMTALESRWLLAGWTDQRGVEVACHYSRTRLVLVKKLPKGVSACVAKYRARSEGLIEGLPEISSFECR